MRKYNPSHGTLLCFVINLFLNLEWAVVAAILLVLHLWLHIPWLFAAIVCAFWVIQALALALLVQWGGKSSSVPEVEQPNKNPYSSQTKDLFQDTPKNDPDQKP